MKFSWLRALVDHRVGKHFGRPSRSRHWWDSKTVNNYVNQQISSEGPGGVVGALMKKSRILILAKVPACHFVASRM